MQLRMREEMSEQLLPKIGNIYFAFFLIRNPLKVQKTYNGVQGLLIQPCCCLEPNNLSRKFIRIILPCCGTVSKGTSISILPSSHSPHKSLLCRCSENDSPQKKREIDPVPPTFLRNAMLTRLLPKRRHHLLGQLGFNINQWE